MSLARVHGPYATRTRAAGFTVVELLVVIAIVGVLVGLVLPALQVARESARRSSCQANTKQIGTGLVHHDGSKRRLPGWRNTVDRYTAAMVATGSTELACVSWTVPILPELGNHELATWYDRYSAVQDDATRKKVAMFICPTSSADMGEAAALCYAVNAGTGAEVFSGTAAPFEQYRGDGVFLDSVGNIGTGSGGSVFDNTRPVYSPGRASLSQVTAGDGNASTLLLAERCGPYAAAGFVAWSDNPRAAQANNAKTSKHIFMHPPALPTTGESRWPQPSTAYRVINVTAETAPLGDQQQEFQMRYPSSRHLGKGVNVVFSDGHTAFLSEAIDSWVYGQMLTPNSKILETDPDNPGSRAYRWQQCPDEQEHRPYIFDAGDLDK
jgi:prepilin-type N-terminal cleavage/methylation domain-containing protein/prepilin-type processing-associated H-X9-DG protein